jgi:Ca2+-binding EF-hand superfamily protein
MELTKQATARIIVASALVATLALPFAASAKGEHRHGLRVSFEQLDADGDGEVTQAEMAARGQARFDAADTDGDGFLSKEEIVSQMGARAAKRADKILEHRDANSDGKLSLDEISPDEDRIAKRFARADADESGGISEAEFEAASKHRRGNRHGDK